MRATSSRRSVNEALIALLAGAALACKRPDRRVERGLLLLEPRAGPPPGPRAREGLRLALGSMPDEVSEALVEHLASALSAADPLVVDVAGDQVGDVMAERRPWLLPLLNAALCLADGAFPLGDGHVVPRSPGAALPGAGSVEAWGSARDGADAERIRLSAWPLSFGFVLRFEHDLAARSAARALRRSAVRAEGPLSLVVDSAVASGKQAIDLGELPALARRALRARPEGLEPLEARLLSALAAPEAAGALLPWLELGPSELLVAPRQGSLARPAGVVAAIVDAVGESAGSVAVRGRGAGGERPLSSLLGGR